MVSRAENSGDAGKDMDLPLHQDLLSEKEGGDVDLDVAAEAASSPGVRSELAKVAADRVLRQPDAKGLPKTVLQERIIKVYKLLLRRLLMGQSSSENAA